MAELCRNYTGTMAELGRNYAGTMQELWLNYAGTMQELWLNYAGTMQELPYWQGKLLNRTRIKYDSSWKLIWKKSHQMRQWNGKKLKGYRIKCDGSWKIQNWKQKITSNVKVPEREKMKTWYNIWYFLQKQSNYII